MDDMGAWIFLLLVVGFIWWLKSPRTKLKRHMQPTLQLPPKPARGNSTAPKPLSYRNYQDDLAQKPIYELDEEERIIRRARDSFEAERENRDAESKAKDKALEDDRNKLRRANEIVRTCYLHIALPFVWNEIKHWPSRAKNDKNPWKPPASDLSESDGRSVKRRWVELRPDGGQLYKIVFEEPRYPSYSYAELTLSIDGLEVLCISVTRDTTKDWSQWEFSNVKALKVGPWIEGFIGFYNRLRSLDERMHVDQRDARVREQAAKIELGNYGGKR